MRLLLIPLSLVLISAAPVKNTPASRMLAKLAHLEGNWEGDYDWTGARTGSGKIQAHYYASSFGSSVIEDMIMDGKPYMTSVYHLDGADLRVTHFCGAQNQPRLRADKVDESAGTAHFAFVDVTNAGPKSGYVEEISIGTPDPNSMHVEFVFKGNGPRSVETIELKRVA